MKYQLSLSSYLCVALFLTGIFRSIYLYSASTQDLRSPDVHDHWYIEPSNSPTTTSFTPPVHAALRNLSLMDDKPNKLFYFVQISDLHISKFQPKGHTIHFLHFLQSVLPNLKPEFVVVTGDLIDGKDKTRTVSAQYIDEWTVYRTALEETILSPEYLNSTIPWYDMRGNHDCFDLDSWKAENNYYKEFGQSAKALDEGKGVYSWQVKKPFGEYQFVAVDSCPRRGPSRPFNFFGYFTTNTMDRLVTKILPKQYNHTFLFSHYPTTTMIPGISSEGYRFQDLAKHFSIYFCGHLHRLTGGIGDVLKTYFRRTDSLELELSDMKDHGSYRIVAVDHDLISFVDLDLPISKIQPVSKDRIVPLSTTSNESEPRLLWPSESEKVHPAPMVLITNPKDARYILPTKEPLHQTKQSSHIRFLVFSKFEPSQLRVTIWIDNKQHPFPTHYVGASGDNSQMPLWTTAWDPNDFDDRTTHTLRIEVLAPDGQVGSQEVPFRMDYTREKIRGGSGEWIIWTQISLLLRFLCIFAIYAMLVVLLIPKLMIDLHRNKTTVYNIRNKILLLIHDIQSGKNKSIYAFFQECILTWFLRLLQFPVLQPYLWNFCFVFLLALLSVPWFYAEFVPSTKKMGFFYLWGILFKDTMDDHGTVVDQWIPLDTWLYCIFHITFSVGVFIFVFIWQSTDSSMAYCLGRQNKRKVAQRTTPRPLCDRVWFQLCVLALCLWRLDGLSYLASYYGGVYPTLVLNLLTWWLMIVSGILLFGRQGIVRWVLGYFHASSTMDVLQQPLEICSACQQQQGAQQQQLGLDVVDREVFQLDPVTQIAAGNDGDGRDEKSDNLLGRIDETIISEAVAEYNNDPKHSLLTQDDDNVQETTTGQVSVLNRRSTAIATTKKED